LKVSGMAFARLILLALTRNWVRSALTFASIVATFCLFGALETIRYEAAGPADDNDIIVVQPDGPGGLPRTYEDT
jgi:hypothetical protein